ncbi:MAG: TrkH family potassium uptake protein [Candidatus Borkfalkiaceae bacterium]|nr:TrkH family potassium uptake protein [Christensenellaceae bacterium]
MPLVVSGEFTSYIDALFEIVSGLTTTGESVVPNVELLSKSILFWRSFSHWIGGMGVIVFVMAITARAPDRSMHILRAEMSGPIIDKLVPRSKDTAKILYLIYMAMTAAMVVALLFCGMPFFDSLLHAFGTAGTGGFGIKSNSVASYSAAAQWVITIGMFLFSLNFNLYYLVLIGKIKTALKSSELRIFSVIVVVSTAIITLNIANLFASFGDALRTAAFQVCSIVSTTGFSTANFDKWNSVSKAVLLLLMFSGGCAGSTAGGLKVSRLVILWRGIKRELKKALHPRTASVVKFDGKRVDEDTIHGVGTYMGVYVFILIAIIFLLSFDPWCDAIAADGVYSVFETNFTAALTCFNNVGPGFAAVGPTQSFVAYSPFSKLVLTFTMLLGRLEIYPLLLTIIPATWIKR